MADDYLWDRSGAPDPDVARLEQTLAKLRYRERAYESPEAAARVESVHVESVRTESALMESAHVEPARSEPARVVPMRRTRGRRLALGALAAGAALAAGTMLAWRAQHATTAPVAGQIGSAAASVAPPVAPPIATAAFAVERLEGAPRVEAAPMDATAQLGVGQWLETDPGSRARITVADIGVVEVSGKSRVQLTRTGPDQHRLDLVRGSLSARVNAPPRLFVVGTPAATAVDLGCAYTLDVDDQGKGLLRVTSGWVSLENGGRSSLVPAGAACGTRVGAGPGTPLYEDAPAALREALERFDFEGGGEAAVDRVLGAARPRDALTVWHLVARVDGAPRGRVVGRLRVLARPPADVRDADVLRLDAVALERWRDAITGAGAAITW